MLGRSEERDEGKAEGKAEGEGIKGLHIGQINVLLENIVFIVRTKVEIF